MEARAVLLEIARDPSRLSRYQEIPLTVAPEEKLSSRAYALFMGLFFLLRFWWLPRLSAEETWERLEGAMVNPEEWGRVMEEAWLLFTEGNLSEPLYLLSFAAEGDLEAARRELLELIARVGRWIVVEGVSFTTKRMMFRDAPAPPHLGDASEGEGKRE